MAVELLAPVTEAPEADFGGNEYPTEPIKDYSIPNFNWENVARYRKLRAQEAQQDLSHQAWQETLAYRPRIDVSRPDTFH